MKRKQTKRLQFRKKKRQEINDLFRHLSCCFQCVLDKSRWFSNSYNCLHASLILMIHRNLQPFFRSPLSTRGFRRPNRVLVVSSGYFVTSSAVVRDFPSVGRLLSRSDCCGKKWRRCLNESNSRLWRTSRPQHKATNNLLYCLKHLCFAKSRESLTVLTENEWDLRQAHAFLTAILQLYQSYNCCPL